jgi:hypothetical protein
MSYPPINHPVVGPDGLLTVPWRSYFQTLSSGVVPGATAINQLTGDVTAGPGTGAQVATIAASAVTTTKIADANVTYAKIQDVSAASRLLGRGSSSGAGDVQEITLGSGLTMTGTSLAASGGSGDSPWPAFTTPVDGDFSWVNQGGASVTVNANGGICLSVPTSASTNLRCRVKTAPSTPYTITAAFLINMAAEDFQNAGLCFRDSGAGTLSTLLVLGATAGLPALVASKWNSATSFSADYLSVSRPYSSGLLYLRIADDGTDRIYSYSADGYQFLTLHTVGRTDFLTANQVGFFGNVQNSASAMDVTLISWEET